MRLKLLRIPMHLPAKRAISAESGQILRRVIAQTPQCSIHKGTPGLTTGWLGV
jgi:hypothetical protein